MIQELCCMINLEVQTLCDCYNTSIEFNVAMKIMFWDKIVHMHIIINAYYPCVSGIFYNRILLRRNCFTAEWQGILLND